MNAFSLMYHDVIVRHDDGASGFPGGEAARYKLTVERFEEHVAAIASQNGQPITTDAFAGRTADRPEGAPPLLVTFDDGGVSAAEYVAGALESRGWRGHFFVTTSYIGRHGFLTRAQIQDLRRRGHVIGSHTHTHPLRIGRCSNARQRDEWTRSLGTLADITGQPVNAASVPGGHYTDSVGRIARDAGIQYLFTSQPVTRVQSVASMLVFGRYSVRRSTSAATVAAIANGRRLPLAYQWMAWQLKAIAKAAGGSLYDAGRARILGRSPQMQWGKEPS